jgi:hypothetical protein
VILIVATALYIALFHAVLGLTDVLVVAQRCLLVTGLVSPDPPTWTCTPVAAAGMHAMLLLQTSPMACAHWFHSLSGVRYSIYLACTQCFSFQTVSQLLLQLGVVLVIFYGLPGVRIPYQPGMPCDWPAGVECVERLECNGSATDGFATPPTCLQVWNGKKDNFLDPLHVIQVAMHSLSRPVLLTDVCFSLFCKGVYTVLVYSSPMVASTGGSTLHVIQVILRYAGRCLGHLAAHLDSLRPSPQPTCWPHANGSHWS